MGRDHDVVVIGAGFAGIYAVHKLRDELGLDVQGFDAAGGPGGTWYWNRYPGARCDFESVHYSYSFSPEIQREWEWSERYAAQPEILAYLEWVADRLDVRKEFRFNARIISMVWDEATSRWTVGTDDGDSCTARFVVSCAGNVSVAKEPEFSGLEDFEGEVYWTSSWPHEPVNFTGKRVGVIGTGSTGIQVIPEVAKEAEHLFVFQRTANYAAPLRNHPVEPEQRRWLAENHEQVRAGSRENFLGAPYERPRPSALEATPEERRRVYDEYWERGGFRLVVSTFQDLLFDRKANDTAADYIRERIRERVADPATAELLCPDDHPYGTKRAPFETDYYEAFNRDDVTLVDVRSAPVEALTATGVQTAAEHYEIDALIFATGFDALTGPLLRMGVVGRDGTPLSDHWAMGPKAYLGIAVTGFPNLFTITGPQSATVLYNNPLAIEDHVDFAVNAITRAIDTDATTIEATPEAERAWGSMTDGILNMTLMPEAKNSWYMGANIPGKPRAAYFFAGGAPLYRAICSEVEARGFAGIAFDGEAEPISPMIRLDPAVALILGLLLTQGTKPLEECSVEETRELMESLTGLQAPPREMRVVEAAYPGPGGDRPARIYVPEAEGPLGVVVFLHPGGWIAGSLDVCDGPCRELAANLETIVVAPSYRLAPEHPFPAATDDAFAAVRWVAETIGEHGGDPERIVVMGESAGGNLAAVAAQRAREEGDPKLLAQVLIYPPIDPRAQTKSRAEFAAGPFLSLEAATQMWMAYLSDPAHAKSPLASPVRAESLAGLPPALILTVECDPTRDEAEDYGRALEAAGVPVEVRRFDGLIHAAFNMYGQVPRSRELHDAIADFLRPLLAAQTAGAAAAPTSAGSGN